MSENKPEPTVRLGDGEITASEWNALVSVASVGAIALRGEKVPRLWVTIAERYVADVEGWNGMMKKLEAIGRAAFPDRPHLSGGPKP